MMTSLFSVSIRSWTGRERTTQTSSRPPTLDFVKPSRRTWRHTALSSPERSRTKPSTCTGSRRNARKAPRARQRPARLSSRSRPPPVLSEARRKRRRDKSTESSLLLGLLSALCPAVIMPIIFFNTWLCELCS